jgi:hypothetical protein
MQRLQTGVFRWYDNNMDFYGLFEADTFAAEDYINSTFIGYVRNEGEAAGLRIAALFVDNTDGAGGYGWWDDELV